MLSIIYRTHGKGARILGVLIKDSKTTLTQDLADTLDCPVEVFFGHDQRGGETDYGLVGLLAENALLLESLAEGAR